MPFFRYSYGYRQVTTLLFLLVCSTSGFTQSRSVIKAFEALDVKDYFQANHRLRESILKMPSISYYGLSMIYSRNDNPYHDLDSSYSYVRKSEVFFDVASSKEQKLLSERGITLDSIQALRLAIENSAYLSATASNQPENLDHFIEYYQNVQLNTKAIRVRDSLLFSILKAQGDAVGLKAFIDTYPDSYLNSEARILYEKVLFREMTAGGTLEEYDAFLLMYPNSPYRKDAEESVFSLFVGDKPDISKYHDFIKKYPESPFTGKAWSRIYDIYMSAYSESAIDSFRIQFPDYPFQDRLIEDIRLSNTQLFPVFKDGKFGYIDYFGELVVDFRYESVGEFTEGLALVYRDGKAGFISKSGDEIVPPFYDEAEPYRNNVSVVTEGGISGIIDRNGKMLIPLSFEEISDFEEGLAAASLDGKFGFIDKAGKTVLPFEYEAAGEFQNGTAVCMKNGKYGIIDRFGNVLVPFEYDAVENFRNKLSRVMSGYHWGIIDRDSRVVLSPVYDEIGLFSDNRAVFVNRNKSGFINSEGKIKVSNIYDAPPDVLEKSLFKKGMAVVRYKGKYGVIDTSGKKILPYRFEFVDPVDSVTFIVRNNGFYGVTDRTGNSAIIPFRYTDLEHTRFGYYIAYSKSKAGLINRKGKPVLDFRYDQLTQVSDTVFVFGLKGKFGLIGISGVKITDAVFTSFDTYMDRFLKLYQEKNFSWFDLMDARFFWDPFSLSKEQKDELH